MLPKEKQMEVLEAYDLTKSYRSAAQLTGVDHHTVTRLVTARALGAEITGEPLVRSKVAEAFAEKITEWIARSNGKVRADVVHDKLVAMGYLGSERTTRRVVAALKAGYEHDNHRIYKPWITEPGAWLQYDFGQGPVIDGMTVILFCAWLAWSRFRVIVPLTDRSLPSVIAALDRTLRTIGGAPTYVLTDNERTVTDRHVAGIAIRNQMAVDVSRYYGITICTCVPFDPESKAWATDCTSWLVDWERVVADPVKDVSWSGPILPRAVAPRMHRSGSSLRSTCAAAPARLARASTCRTGCRGRWPSAPAARRDALPCRCRPPMRTGPAPRGPSPWRDARPMLWPSRRGSTFPCGAGDRSGSRARGPCGSSRR